MSHFKETCPGCYMNKGYSVSLKQIENKWHCGQCGADYLVGEDGYFKKAH